MFIYVDGNAMFEVASLTYFQLPAKHMLYSRLLV